MRNSDYDRLVSTFMFTCAKEISSSSLICSLYFAQKVGFNLGFNFKPTQRGIQSIKVETYLDELVYQGRLSSTKDMRYVYLLDYKNIVSLEYSDYEALDLLGGILSDLSPLELTFLVTLDVLQNEVYQKISKGGTNLEDGKLFVIDSLKRMFQWYTDANFIGAFDRLLLIDNLMRDFNKGGSTLC